MAAGERKKNPLKQDSLEEKQLQKVPSGIKGLDDITGGGLPKGRPTLVCGGPGCGKTLFGMEFLVRGALEYGEPGVFVAFEESPKDLIQNFASLDFDLDKMQQQKKLVLDHVYIERSEIEVTGEYDLEGLFVRIGHLVDSIGAKRIVLDTIEALFASLPNEGILRAELRRLFRFLRDRGLTAIITAERGQDSLTRYGMEEYVSDAVINLDNRVTEQITTRRMRIVKYRGSSHGANEYPFMIGDDGFSVLPITSIGLDHKVSKERISTGVEKLDEMFGGKGFYRGGTILISGTAGTGKSTLSASFANATCARGERCLYLALEEAQSQIIRNMRSVGLNLEQWCGNGLLKIHSSRPTMYGLEMHLVAIHSMVEKFKPSTVIFDPMSNLMSVGNEYEVKAMLTRLIDYVKMKQITLLFTHLSHPDVTEETELGMSSLMDTWIQVRDIEIGGERNRGIYVLKSRGMAHSNQIREFLIGKGGLNLIDVYLGKDMVLTGSARAAQEAMDREEATAQQQARQLKRRELERRRKTTEAQMAELQARLDQDEEEMRILQEQAKAREAEREKEKQALSRLRKVR